MGKDGGPVLVDRIFLRVPFWPFAAVTVSLPAFSLAICFITAFIFRFDDVNETMCEVSTPFFSLFTAELFGCFFLTFRREFFFFLLFSGKQQHCPNTSGPLNQYARLFPP